jgi:hypothetical protein
LTRRDHGDDVPPYDTGEWVDVGRDGLWKPSGGERLRALTIIGVALGVLLALAGLASVGSGDDEDVAASSTTSADPEEVVTTTSIPPTTEVDPASLAGEPTPGVCRSDTARAGAALRSRSEVVVLVLNATSRTGHAGSVTDELAGSGYGTIVPGNAGRLEVTTIEYLPGFCAESVMLALDLGLEGAEVRPLPDDTDVFLGRAQVLVTLGSDSL